MAMPDPSPATFNPEAFITDRLRGIDASGIRRVFDLAAELDDPINLSIGQPDFDVPTPVKTAATEAIDQGLNRYTQTQGARPLRETLIDHIAGQFPGTLGALDGDGGLNAGCELLVTSGVSGGLMLSLLTTVGPGDEVLIPDPFFVMYKHLVTLTGATPVFVDTYPDFQLTADRVAAHLTPRSKVILLNSPSNPTGAVAPAETCQALAQLAEANGLLLISDEIYDRFCYVDQTPDTPALPCPSPASSSGNVLVLRGFSKTYGMTGWRLGYAVGPKPIVDQMTKLQQYSFVCAPSMTQAAGVAAMQTDVAEHVTHYRQKRDKVIDALSPYYQMTTPGGAFYVFPRVPEHLQMTGQQFVEKAIDHGLLIIPGNVFSQQDTHFRLSYACDDQTLDRGLDVLIKLAQTRSN
jgi:aspartate/methionine/tyrosine aminotransferase